MPSPMNMFSKPRLMTIKYGKGTIKARVGGTYTRYINGKKHTSHQIIWHKVLRRR